MKVPKLPTGYEAAGRWEVEKFAIHIPLYRTIIEDLLRMALC